MSNTGRGTTCRQNIFMSFTQYVLFLHFKCKKKKVVLLLFCIVPTPGGYGSIKTSSVLRGIEQEGGTLGAFVFCSCYCFVKSTSPLQSPSLWNYWKWGGAGKGFCSKWMRRWMTNNELRLDAITRPCTVLWVIQTATVRKKMTSEYSFKIVVFCEQV